MMQSDSGRSRSIWMETAEAPIYPRLSQPLRTQVCVVGGGIAGLTTAYLLAREGVRVALVDKGQVGGGETGRTTAQLTCILDRTYREIEQLRGQAVARAAAESHMAAISLIERIASDEGIGCDFQRMDGYIFPRPDDDGQELAEELGAALRSGLRGVELVDQLPIAGLAAGPALRFPNQGHFHPLKYLAGLARAVESHGGQIYGDTQVTKVEDGKTVTVETEGGPTISAEAAVLATHMPINDLLGYSSRVFPYRTYVIGLSVPSGSVPYGLYFDTEDPYHYIRLQPTAGGDLLIVGGEDHKVGQAEDMEARYARLERWTRERFLMAGPVTHRWSGQVLNTPDGMGMFGISPGAGNIYVITGQSGLGMTHSTIGAQVVSDILRFRDNPWAAAYDPGRLPLSGLGEVVSEGLNTVAQAREWVSGGEVESEEQILPGKGAVIGWGLGKAAVYRDEQGRLHRRSAICTHLGCVVSWNDGEKSWDCPCHGSRFDPHGKVLHGPATEALGPAEDRG